jgi:hypothetical protein
VFFVRGRRRGARPFVSRFRTTVARTREHYYSLFITLLVKSVLFVFLWMLFRSTVRVIRGGFLNISAPWRFLLPAAIAAAAALTGYHIFKNMRDIQRYRSEIREARISGRRM